MGAKVIVRCSKRKSDGSCSKILGMFQWESENLFVCIVTCDGIWAHHTAPEIKLQSKAAGENAPNRTSDDSRVLR